MTWKWKSRKPSFPEMCLAMVCHSNREQTGSGSIPNATKNKRSEECREFMVSPASTVQSCQGGDKQKPTPLTILPPFLHLTG